MTYQHLLELLQTFNKEDLQSEVLIWDIYKNDGYMDVQFDSNMLALTFGEN